MDLVVTKTIGDHDKNYSRQLFETVERTQDGEHCDAPGAMSFRVGVSAGYLGGRWSQSRDGKWDAKPPSGV